jgi:hypothetical protein
VIRATLTQTNIHILQKNFLLGKNVPSLVDYVGQLAGLPGDEPTAPFLTTRARRSNFSADELLTELYDRRSLIKTPLMRNVDYVVRTAQVIALHSATARQRNQAFNAQFRLWGVDSNEDIENLGPAILEVMDDQPLTAAAIVERLPANLIQELSQTSRGGRVSRTDNVSLALRWLVGQGALAVSNQATDWRQETRLYARFGDLYPGLDLTDAPGEAEAQKELVRAYLAVFGPATEADISFWTGFGKSETARATAGLSAETSLAMVDGIPGTLLMLRSQVDGLRSAQIPAEPVVNIVPANDPYVTACRASRSRYFENAQLQRQIFNSTGAARPAILVNGQVGGSWSWSAAEGQDIVTWRLFDEVEPAVESAIVAEIEAMATFIHPQARLQRDRV